MTRNVVFREDVRAGAVDCPLCGRQIAFPDEHLVAFGATAELTAETADAVECPACSGVTFFDSDASTDPDE
ncbi:hypothetical protein [Halospeciosus flavus]|uniref:Small CPxCG-related zinc finger protein n=1 Tax=Halospeciosus flavus TaxID=3032283 RepID=A0ABD5Z4K9_9EURY|nr:hypothetical protein [Halospeciosus flavus]